MGLRQNAGGLRPLSDYRYAAVAGSVTVNGIFVNSEGQLVGNPFTASVTTAWKSWAEMYAAALPAGAARAVFDASGDLRWTTLGESGAAPDYATYAAMCPTRVAGKSIEVGA